MYIGDIREVCEVLWPPKKLLVGLDPVHDGSVLVERAAELGRRFGATIILFDCVQNQYVSRRYFRDERALTHARWTLVKGHRDRLQRLAQRMIVGGLNVIVDATWDAPLDEGLIRAASRHDADWILVGIGYHPVHRLPFLASTDGSLIRHATCPLLLVQQRRWSSPPRIVSAIDPLHSHGKPADLDRWILEAGACICRHGGGHLYVFHAFEPILRAEGGDALEPLPVEYAEATLEGAHNAAVEALLDDLPETAGNVRIAEGRPEEKLPLFAEEIRADVVIIGAVARNPWQRIFIGSTAEKVLDRLASDILIIKPEGFLGSVETAPLHRQVGGPN
jgi:universal stress protein E